jgi:hypothetical protein
MRTARLFLCSAQRRNDSSQCTTKRSAKSTLLSHGDHKFFSPIAIFKPAALSLPSLPPSNLSLQLTKEPYIREINKSSRLMTVYCSHGAAGGWRGGNVRRFVVCSSNEYIEYSITEALGYRNVSHVAKICRKSFPKCGIWRHRIVTTKKMITLIELNYKLYLVLKSDLSTCEILDASGVGGAVTVTPCILAQTYRDLGRTLGLNLQYLTLVEGSVLLG